MDRILLYLFLAFSISGCSTVWVGALQTLKDATFPKASKPIEITKKNVEDTPFYQLHVKIPKAESILILTRINGTFRYWQTGTSESLVLSNGLLHRTTGLPENLEQTRFIGNNPFEIGLNKIKDKTQSIREIDLSGYRYGIRVISTFHIIGYESVKLIEDDIQLLRIDEKINISELEVSATNHYWVDKNGFVWKSEQHLWPEFIVKITELRPYFETKS